MAAKYNDDVRKGDTFERSPIYRVKATKEGVDLTGCTVSGGITKGTTVVPFHTSILDATGGQFKFWLTNTETAALEVGTWSMDLRITFPGSVVKTIFTGNFVVYA